MLYRHVSFQAKITGTPVTYENFMAWKLKFDEERKALTSKIETKIKPTGKAVQFVIT